MTLTFFFFNILFLRLILVGIYHPDLNELLEVVATNISGVFPPDASLTATDGTT